MYDNLNSEQLEAVIHPNGPLLVLAGAGSGKTRCLTTRIAHLISRGVQPDQILAVTFTNRAADEMLARVAKMTGMDTSGMWVSTFHSACLRILRRHAQLVGLDNGFSILDDSEQLSLVKKVLKELQDQDTDPKEALESISRAKNELLDLDNPIYRAYQEKLRQANSVDFDDLIKKTVELFQANPRVLERFQEKFQHILVDEYQDTNYAQHVLIDLLAQKHRNVFVVGDTDQNVYSWRGARLENTFDFIKHYSPSVVKLERNYRSTETILSAANELIQNNENRIEKNLWTDKKGGAPVSLFEAGDDLEEANFIAGRIKQIMRDGQTQGLRSVLPDPRAKPAHRGGPVQGPDPLRGGQRDRVLRP
ncbi:MAG TPA: UvrD-helicase domain-containing protein [Spirochaetia bacterium]|nr:UvrD-helicase domain-containing protein [Spirochaetia bacterium]